MSVQEQISSIEQKLDHLIYLLDYEKREWINPEEAARELGLQVGSSREYTRTLAILRKGPLNSFIKGRPYMYNKDNVRDFAKKVREGEEYLPKRIRFDKGE